MSLLGDNIAFLEQTGLLSPTATRDASLQGLFSVLGQIGNRSAARLTPTPPPLNMNAPMQAYNAALTNELTRGALARKLRQDEALKTMFATPEVTPAEVQAGTQALVDPIAQGRETKMMADANLAQDPLTEMIDFDATDAAVRENITPRIQEAVRQRLSTPSALRGVPDSARSLLQGMAKAGLGREALSAAVKLATATPEYQDVMLDGKETFMTASEIQNALRSGQNVAPIPKKPLVQIGKTTSKIQETVGVDFVKKELPQANQAIASNTELLTDLTSAQNLLSKIENTGFGSPFITSSKAALAQLGFEQKDLLNREAFNAGINRLILPMVKQLGVNPTDRDLEFILEAAPSLSKTPGANRIIIDAMQEKARRNLQRASTKTKFFRENQLLLRKDPLEFTAALNEQMETLNAKFRADNQKFRDLRKKLNLKSGVPASVLGS